MQLFCTTDSSSGIKSTTVKDHLWGWLVRICKAKFYLHWKNKIPFVICCNWSHQLTSSTWCKRRSNCAQACAKMISAAEYPIQSSLWDDCYFEKENIYRYIAKMVWIWEQCFQTERCCVTYWFFPFLLMKSNRYKTTFEVFSQTTVYVKRSVCREGSRERISTEARTTATLGTATDPALPPITQFKSATAMEAAEPEVRWLVKESWRQTTLIQLKLQEEQPLSIYFFYNSSSNHST